MILTGIILFFLVLAWDVISDYRKWLNERSPNHEREAWLRSFLLLPSIVLLSNSHVQINLPTLFNVVFMEFFVFWLLFDGFYNKIRGFDWWYSGSIDKDESKLDNFQRSIGLRFSKIVKISGAIAFTAYYIASLYTKLL